MSPQTDPKNILLFRAEIEDGPAPEGVFFWHPDGVEVFALAGERSPRGSTFKSFSDLSIAGIHPMLPQFKMAFIAELEEGRKSVVIKSSYGDAVEILTTGDRIGPKSNEVVDDFTISRLGFSLGCVAHVHRRKKNKTLRYKKVITLHDGFLAVGDALKEGVRFPTLGKVKRILDPPSMNFQQGYAAIEFKNRVTALATRDIDGGSEIITKSGDQATHAPAESIQSFGPPITSSFRLEAFDEFGRVVGPIGIVSPVHLIDGRVALWLGVFTSKVPRLDGHTRLLLVDGSTSVDGKTITLRSFSPVKLTNSGVLLLRATIGEEDEAREALFLIEGLFDVQ